jgi:hypothetical protein
VKWNAIGRRANWRGLFHATQPVKSPPLTFSNPKFQRAWSLLGLLLGNT